MSMSMSVGEFKKMMGLTEVLSEYDSIVKGVRHEYAKEELTTDIIRKEHPELNFMDNEEIETIIRYANHGR